jgi:transposase-like protein
VLKTTRKQEVQANVREYVLKGSEVYTDALRSYKGLDRDHAIAYVDGNVHTNGLENFWSLLKRTLKGTYVHVAPFHLFRNLDEQAYRFNERKNTDGERFLKAIATVANRRLSYTSLTGKELA